MGFESQIIFSAVLDLVPKSVQAEKARLAQYKKKIEEHLPSPIRTWWACSAQRLRRRAQEQGFDEFRLVVVNPPHQTATKIEGLDLKLARYLRENLPHEIRQLYEHAKIQGVSGIEIDSVSISQDSTRVAGTAVVNIQVHSAKPPSDSRLPIDENSGLVDYAGGPPVISEDGTEWLGWDDLPFSFDIELNRDLEITTAYSLNVDVSTLD